MVEYREFRWKIGAYSAETMPLDRLMEYIKELMIVLGDPQHMHLIRVESSSTAPVFKVEAEAAPRIEARVSQVKAGIAPIDARRSFRRINTMLREDKTDAVIVEGTAEIIQFPGINTPPPEQITGIQQPGSLDGKLVSIGGVKDVVPLQLETPEKVLTNIYAKRALAKEIGHLLFEPVRLFGTGRWNRDEDGEWHLGRFAVNSFDPLSADNLPSVVSTLRSLDGEWGDDPLAVLSSFRNGDGGQA